MAEVDWNSIKDATKGLTNFTANAFRDKYLLQLPAHPRPRIRVLDQPSCLCWYIEGPEALVVIADKFRLMSCGRYRVSAQEEKQGGHHYGLLPNLHVKGWSCAVLVGTDVALQLQMIPVSGDKIDMHPWGGAVTVMEVVAWCYMDATQRRAALMKRKYWAPPRNRDWLEATLDLTPEGYRHRASYPKILDVETLQGVLPDRRDW